MVDEKLKGAKVIFVLGECAPSSSFPSPFPTLSSPVPSLSNATMLESWVILLMTVFFARILNMLYYLKMSVKKYSFLVPIVLAKFKMLAPRPKLLYYFFFIWTIGLRGKNDYECW